MRPFKSRETFHRSKRRFNQCRAMKRAKLKDSVGTIQTKNMLRCSFLNVDGLRTVRCSAISLGLHAGSSL